MRSLGGFPRVRSRGTPGLQVSYSWLPGTNENAWFMVFYACLLRFRSADKVELYAELMVIVKWRRYRIRCLVVLIGANVLSEIRMSIFWAEDEIFFSEMLVLVCHCIQRHIQVVRHLNQLKNDTSHVGYCFKYTVRPESVMWRRMSEWLWMPDWRIGKWISSMLKCYSGIFLERLRKTLNTQ